jgi:NAD(P)-dependent dehydrogenase (short-subunit alcohol dehydrogenase family)
VGDEAALDATMARTLEAFGRIDGCFANAGIGGRGTPSFDAMTLDEWRRVMRINLDGVFLTFRAAAKHMVARGGGGSLVATASTAAIMGAARNEHYGASKGAVISLIRGLAVEYARHGIRANAILPGWVETEMTQDLFGNDRFAANVKPRIPMRRWGTAADFEGIAVYLMSEVSSWHTGDSFVIDGGYTIF